MVQGNFIGTDASGNVALPNKQGVIVGATSTNNTIGGTTTASRNVISGNTTVGLTIYSGSDNNVAQGNYIGVGADGTTPLGNGSWGVYLDSSTTIAIGGSISGSGNRIWNNGNAGIAVSSTGSGVSILGNSIRANAGLGIDLNPAGVNANDAGDSDTGANGLQNFPVLTSANSSGGSTTVAGTLNSVAGTSFRIELFASNSCDASGNGEGDTYLGFVTESTTGSGDLSFSTTLPVALTWGQIVTATATNLATSETSEFSACLTAVAPAIAPIATTSAATVITATGATLNGTVVANDASAAVTFEWGLSNAYGSTATAAESPLPGSATGAPVSAAVTGLACNAGYHYRVTATNSVDSAQGGDQTFTTAACAPVATTGAASAVTANGATLAGTVTAGGAASTVTFQYGLTTSYGSTATAAESPVPGSATNATVSAAVTGLACNTVYHYRVAAGSSGGTTQGSDQTFSTTACAPVATTGAASAVTANGATLGGTVAAGGAASTVTFQYGLTTSYGSTATAAESPLPGSATNATVSASVTGLTCNTVYHYRVTATNSVDSAQGGDQAFTTAACAPVATTGAASAVTANGATLGGTVTAGGAASTVTFQYGLTTSYGSTATATESPVPGSATNATVSASVTALACNTVYHYRVTAASSADSAQGSDQTFTTAACGPSAPVVTTGAASAVTANGATLGGTVTAGGAATTVTFQYGLTTSYGSNATAIESPVTGSATNAAVSAAVTGLTCNTVYHYRVTATNSADSAQGSDQTFTTAACTPTVTGANPVGGGTITATVSGCGATCAFTQGTFIPVSGHPRSPPVPPPADYTFPYGLFDFVAGGLTAGSTVTITLVYPDNLPAGTVYQKYGPTPDDASPHWYPMPATISGNTVTLTITDGSIGDDDLIANGSIVDPGGPAIPSRSGAAVIPTLSQWCLFLLIGIMGALGIVVAQRRRFG